MTADIAVIKIRHLTRYLTLLQLFLTIGQCCGKIVAAIKKQTLCCQSQLTNILTKKIIIYCCLLLFANKGHCIKAILYADIQYNSIPFGPTGLECDSALESHA